VTRTGGVDLFPPGAAIDPSTYRSSLDACGVDHEWIDGAEVRRRFPAFGRGTAVTDDVMAIYSDETGIIPAAEATAILHRLAVEHGARLRPGVAVRALRPVGGEVDVVTDDAVVRCGSVVVCADAWTNRLLRPLGHGIELVVTREQVTYFATADVDDLRSGRLPVWIWMDDPSFYGFPEFGVPGAFQGRRGLRRSRRRPGHAHVDADPVMERRLAEFVVRLVGGRGALPRTTSCLYTLTPDRDFVVDRLLDCPQVVVGLGAAHGFKFGAWFGRQLAAWVTGGDFGPEFAPFAITRQALRLPATRAAWLV
jgi:sarcosine oxidase